MTKSIMPLSVIPSSTDLFKDVLELYQFLLNCQEELEASNCSRIVSFSREISTVDPLAILEELVTSNSRHFYWENRHREEAIAGCGSSKSIEIESGERFILARQFIEECLEQTSKIGDIELAGPHFFCSFTFFPSSSDNSSAFPDALVFVPLFQVVRKKNSCTLVVNLNLDRSANLQDIANKIDNYIKKIDWAKYERVSAKKRSVRLAPLNNKVRKKNANEFKAAVEAALNSIERQELTKIVLARAIDVISSVPFQLVPSLENLRRSHPDCYIFSIGNGKGQNFIGASPERIISIQNQQLNTDALAGSAPRGKTLCEDADLGRQLTKSEKEKREHQAVIEFIIQRLCQLGLEPERAPRQLLQLSNIQHLWTPISARLPAHLHPLEILARLHPTPAVAGVPAEIACESIRRYETFDRALYAAPIGWVDERGNSQFVVGIRSALIEGNRARLYAGAGIVAGSVPDKEFAEIQLKLQSLLKALV